MAASGRERTVQDSAPFPPPRSAAVWFIQPRMVLIKVSFDLIFMKSNAACQFQGGWFCVVFMPHSTNLENLSIIDCPNACCQGVTAGGTPIIYQIASWSIQSVCFCHLSETISRDGLPQYSRAHLLSNLTIRSQRGFWWQVFFFFESDIECLILMLNLETFIMQVISTLSFSVVY